MAKSDELRLRGVSNKIKDDLKAIAKNKGISMNDYVKLKLRDMIDSEPAHLKRAPTV